MEAALNEDAETYLLEEASRRRFLYRDVEELIEHGFLRQTLVINGCPVTFRSFLPADLTRFQARSGTSRTGTDVLRWSLASSVWIVDGYELSMNPADNASYFIYKEWLQDMHMAAVEMMAVVIKSFQNRIARAVRLTEAYCYETYSRGLWRMLGRSQSGLENANLVRRIWVAHNLAEDASKVEERAWSHTQAIVGSMSNKAAKHIKTSLEKSEKKEEERRARVIEDAVNWVIQGDEEQKPITVTINGQQVVVPKIHAAQTTQDLEEEMRRVFAGEKDYHDKMVDDYHAAIRKRTKEKREAYNQARMEARQRSLEAEEEHGHRALVGYTREQLAELNPSVLNPKTTAMVTESSQEQYLFGRYFEGELRPGVLTTKLTVEEPDAKDLPKRETVEVEPQSLQDKIQNRRPQLKPDGTGG